MTPPPLLSVSDYMHGPRGVFVLFDRVRLGDPDAGLLGVFADGEVPDRMLAVSMAPALSAACGQMTGPTSSAAGCWTGRRQAHSAIAATRVVAGRRDWSRTAPEPCRPMTD